MRHDIKQIKKAPAWVIIALAGLAIVSVGLLTGNVHVTGTVPGWVVVVALISFAGLIFV